MSSSVAPVDRLRAQAMPTLRDAVWVYAPSLEATFASSVPQVLRPLLAIFRGPYISLHTADNKESLAGYVVLRPSSSIRRVSPAEVAAMRLSLPASPPLGLLLVSEGEGGGMPPSGGGGGGAPGVGRGSSAPVLRDRDASYDLSGGSGMGAPVSIRLPGERPSVLAFSDVSTLYNWWVAMDGVVAILRGIYTLPREPSPIPSISVIRRAHDSVVLEWVPQHVHRVAERVIAYIIEYRATRSGDLIDAPLSPVDDADQWAFRCTVAVPWVPQAAGTFTEAAPWPSTASLELLPGAAPRGDDLRIPGWTGGEIPCARVVSLKPRTRYQFRIRAHNAVGSSPIALHAASTAALPSGRTGVGSEPSGTGAGGGRPVSVVVTTLGPPSRAPTDIALREPSINSMVVLWTKPIRAY